MEQCSCTYALPQVYTKYGSWVLYVLMKHMNQASRSTFESVQISYI